jgi:hypothetical protein
MHRNYILIFVMAAAFLAVFPASATAKTKGHGLQADCGQENKEAAESPCPAQKDTKAKKIDRETCSAQPNPADDIVGGTRKALACEWRKAAAVQSMLGAMGDYISNHQDHAVQQVNDNVGYKTKVLYKNMQSLPTGEKNALGTAVFLRMLASANTLKISKDNKDMLIAEVKLILCNIFNNGDQNKLIKSNFDFTQGDCCTYHAIFELLSAVRPFKETDKDEVKEKYVSDLEILRAAFALNNGELAGAISDKIAGPQEAQ